jgi:hypothetical protein
MKEPFGEFNVVQTPIASPVRPHAKSVVTMEMRL